ncbi:MAG: Aldehyde dehydrogenase [Candidatus Gottesmanbacteria bacterium GW2011_GWB1_43_11]|uniref:Aldehyde dehydrogenase n=1 Tax=Candidatus Gottesmanbacteria bacterium GW2011_GWB1_43_11 TaxID=1618446 RepID=A0A0G1CMQ7_9BACT|nr:MAG: Aldehyde dehydrogenase [Candidatus Gottesmanbacteria bacterium GW2011_GWA2_42_16]KKS55409.1 MAG: Aldehyde dehydrogenase [Candidatus Gottesmanbacteria bacterium GW2011_GWA1_42_26]KKS81889.1 MAG: NAD-dependent aldehyde dehydrogenase [Candidatus Gottesmanbacteria bacterium GW2011_GWC1_43_10]KKS86809.1 MAG: Aldehyde dehydrogenase [Candidatus Gottesmanbacteria bacterium GW2011_GWB1_43_11]OGG10603.1 MAG: hypothetical protein A2699_01790 [Candidatus Gottesmanbacteria bacterium RIFCSPHIGHO2_01_
MIYANSLIAGNIVTTKHVQTNFSPVDNIESSQVSLLTQAELSQVFIQAKKIKNREIKSDYSELDNLARYLKNNYLQFINQIIKDAGFTKKDAQDLVDCSIEFCEDYHLHLNEIIKDEMTTSFSFKKGVNHKIRLASTPFGLIAATTPRNTPLITELTVIIHALWSGNVVVLRPSPGVAATVALLIDGLKKSFRSETLARLNIAFSDAKDFVSTSLEYSNLLHYVGSTKYLEGTLVAGIKKGVKVLVDGDGCSLVLVDTTANIEEAAKTCYRGLIRCNGEICISVRVIVVEQSVYEEFSAKFLSLVNKTIVSPPNDNKKSLMGPLFSSAQAENILNVAKKYKLLSGQLNPLSYGQNYISPVVVELKPTDRAFLRESLFGPIVGISSYQGNGWKRWLAENPINLTDVLFSQDEGFIEEFLNISKSPRKVVNADPTVESVFEPWGAFLPSGWNDVSYWYYKYRNYYQLVRESK